MVALGCDLNRMNYDKFPSVAVPESVGACVVGWEAIGQRLRGAVQAFGPPKVILTVDCYPGVFEAELLANLTRELQPTLTIHAGAGLKSPMQIESLCAPFLGGSDPVFGRLSDLELPTFFDRDRLVALRKRVSAVKSGTVLVLGFGARLIAEGDLLVYADMARWELQQRQRRQQIGNFGINNSTDSAAAKYKRAFFVDWRVADRWKRPQLGGADFFLDTNDGAEPKLAEGAAVRRGLRHAVTRPFRVVPFFDPAPWGGQWIKEVCDLDRAAKNYGWGFDCVPEENSLLLDFGNARFELPALDLVLDQSEALLGNAVCARFDAEFPIRFDFLDTMGGGNLSFQVHPLAEYISRNFGMSYTQDESYYLLDAGPDASVYLGLRENIDPQSMARDLEAAQAGGAAFDADRYSNKWPAKKHDHFLIPAGTVHCSGANALVLEISATPYIFTFKLWDWNRLGLDGKPRPIHLQHGLANIQWERTTEWTRCELVNRIEPQAAGDGWREERTGLHELQFIETRRHWFTKSVPHDTAGAVNVLNLVEGDQAIVESPSGAFEPFVIHYAETFIVPAAVGRYTIRPHGSALGQECATLKAFVRT